MMQTFIIFIFHMFSANCKVSDLSLDMQYEHESLQYDRDCLVLRLTSTCGSEVLKYPQNFANKSFFPNPVVTTLEERLESLHSLNQGNSRIQLVFS